MWKNRLIYIGLVIYAGFFIILYSEYTSFLVGAMVVLIPICMALVLRIFVYPGVEISLKEDIGCMYQEEISKVILKIENQSILPILSAIVHFELSYGHGEGKKYKKIKIYSNGKGKQEFEIAIKPEHCGIVNAKVKQVQIQDYFRIFSMTKKDCGEIRLFVLPKQIVLEESEKHILSQKIAECDLFSKEKPGDDPSEIFDIRKYREGDRLQRIHWKLSSKKEQMLVKEFSFPIVDRTALFLFTEWEEECYQSIDSAIQKLSAAIEGFLQQEKEVIVYWCGENNSLYHQVIGKKDEIIFLIQQIYENGFVKKINCREIFLKCSQIEEIKNGYCIDKNGIAKLSNFLINNAS